MMQMRHHFSTERTDGGLTHIIKADVIIETMLVMKWGKFRNPLLFAAFVSTAYHFMFKLYEPVSSH